MKHSKIILPYGSIKKITLLVINNRTHKSPSLPTIRKALRGDYSESNPEEKELAERIRKCAINLGGVTRP